MKTFRQYYVAELDLSREKPELASIEDRRQQTAPGKGSLPSSGGQTTIYKSAAPKPPIPKPRPMK